MVEGVILDEQVGDERKDQAFWTFVNTHRERAVRLAWRLCGGNDANAEDIVQDALCEAYCALPNFREESTVETWFYRILVRKARQHQRWRVVRERWHALWSDDIPHPQSENDSEPGLRERIVQAVNFLPQGQREVFVLMYLEGFTLSETSKLLKKPAGTVKSHLHRALKSLRDQLNDLKP